MDEPGLELLRVLRSGRPPRSALGADRERHLHLATGHRPVLRRLVDELLHGDRQEVLVHDLDDRAHALDRRADTAADDRHLGDRRVAHAAGTELVEQALRHRHRTAHLGDVLAHDEDALVLAKRLAERYRARPRGRSAQASDATAAAYLGSAARGRIACRPCANSTRGLDLGDVTCVASTERSRSRRRDRSRGGAGERGIASDRLRARSFSPSSGRPCRDTPADRDEVAGQAMRAEVEQDGAFPGERVSRAARSRGTPPRRLGRRPR